MALADATLRMILLGEDRSASKALKGVGDESQKTESKLHKVGHAAGVALAGGFTLAAAAAVNMTKKAAEDQISAEKLAQTLHKATGATKEQQGAVEDWISAQEKAFGVTDTDLRPALSRLAVATGSVTKAQKLAKLAMDVSAGTGKSLESVSLALAKAQTGNISGLSRLGIATKNAKGETLSLTQVTKQLSDHYSGAAAKAAETTAGKQKILEVQMDELQETIGYKLLPVMMKLVNIGLKVVDWVSHNTTTVGVLVGVLGGLFAITWATSKAIAAWTAITKIARGVQILFTNAQWALNVAMEANPIGLVVVAIVALVAALVLAYKKSDTFRNIVQGAFHAVARAAQVAFGWIKDHWKLLLAIITGPIGAAVIAVVSNWGKIKAATMAAWNAIKSIVRGAWDGIRAVTVDQVQAVLGLIRGAAGKITGLGGEFLSAGKALIGKLFDGIVAAARGGIGFVTDLVSAIKSSINSALHLPLQINFDKGPLHIHATVIPALAKGGIVSRPTMALIGEAGPEAVVPLSGARGRAALGGGNIYIEVNTNGLVDKTSLMRDLHAALRQYNRVALGGAGLGLG